MDELKSQVAKTAKEMARLGLVTHSWGNVSAKDPKSSHVVITPSGLNYDRLNSEDMVVVDPKGTVVEGHYKPSVETPMHTTIYRARPDVNAIVHTHSLYASVVAVTSTHIPPIVDEMVVYIGGAIEVADYGFPGTEELANAGVEALGDRRAVILRNHGMCAAAPTVKEALRIAILVERVAQIFVHAETMGGATEIPDYAIETERQVYLMRSGLTGTD